ncbi:hypothetical protein GYMLUDRAFT_86193 [Collybiopsis luxurians FD-317 M1]|uniref:Uncharacterized protein n=1 Tax=Collybiopsis luxurians FD-317 M1 TaxID=944289 RepID=A0A0D0C7W3_9AGAR|nr:hypothetical protein GYMLUDRAFT_86193 [Collybiopsis luxurians FD-317 M1]
MSNEVAPPYSKNAAINLPKGVLDAIDGSQQQAFLKDIKELGDDVKCMLNCIETLHSLLLQESPFVKAFQKLGFKFRDAEKSCKTQIQLIRQAAEKVTVNVVHPFVKIWAPMAEEESDENVLTEFMAFSEELASFKAPDVKFDLMLHMIQTIKEECGRKLAIEEKYNSDLARLNKEIEVLEEKKKACSGLMDDLIPNVMKALGLNSNSYKLYLACGPTAIALKEGFSRFNFEDMAESDVIRIKEEDRLNSSKQVEKLGVMANYEALRDAAKTRGGSYFIRRPSISTKRSHSEYESKLTEKRKQLNEIQLQHNSRSDSSRRNIMVSRASAFELKISLLIPKLKVIVNIAEAVKGEVDSHITFLQSPESRDRDRRQSVLGGISLAREMYALLDDALEGFVTQL